MLEQPFFSIATRKESFENGKYHRLDPRKISDLRFLKQTCSETVISVGKLLDTVNFLIELLEEQFLEGEHFEESTLFVKSTLRGALLECRPLSERRALRGEH